MLTPNQIKSNQPFFDTMANQIKSNQRLFQIKSNQIKLKRMTPIKYQYDTFFNTFWYSNRKVAFPPWQNRLQIWILLTDYWIQVISQVYQCPKLCHTERKYETAVILMIWNDLDFFKSNQIKSNQVNFPMPPNQIKSNHMVLKLVIQSRFNQIKIWFGCITDM